MTGRELAALSGQESIVVIRRPFVHWLGNIGRALLVDQLLFESNARDGGEFTRTDAEWQNTLLLSRREIRDARDHLIGLGVLEASSKGMPRRMWYKLDADKAAKLFSAFIAERGASTLEWPNGRASLAKRAGKSGQTGASSIQGGEGIREGKESPDSAPTDAAGETPTATPDPDAWLPLRIAIARTGTNRPNPRIATKGGKPYGWIGEIVGAVGAHADGNPEAAYAIWECFDESLSPDDHAKYVNAGNLCGRFHGWAANGGGPKIEAMRGYYAGRPA